MDHQRSVQTPNVEYAADRFKKIAANTPVYEKVMDACKDLVVHPDVLRRVMNDMEESITKGLAGEKTSLMMLPSFVRAVPDGAETGDYLALDFNESNFRILYVRLEGGKQEIYSKVFRVPADVMNSNGEKLFDHIAASLAVFLKSQGLSKRRLPLGFTFSFPCSQERLAVARLIRWVKGFNAHDAVGKDVAALLREAIQRRRDVNVDVVAVLNDTVGTLLSCAFKDSNCQVGVILGTGTNACYMESLENCPKLSSLGLEKDRFPKQMIINMEWGAFGDCGELDHLRTAYDREIDQNSINRNEHIFEKMASGMYMGELVRLVLLRLAKEGVIFNGSVKAISKKDAFPSNYVPEIESSQQEALPHWRTTEILAKIGVPTVTELDCCVVAYVCEVVSTRAANLVAACLATVLKHLGRKAVTVGVDGNVYNFYPNFSSRLNNVLNDLLPTDIHYQLLHTSDGSGCGAALLAAVATREYSGFAVVSDGTLSD